MIPSNPLLAVYALGVFGFAFLFMATVVARPTAFGMLMDEVERAGIGRGAAIGFLTVAYTVGWPLTVAIWLATGRRD